MERILLFFYFIVYVLDEIVFLCGALYLTSNFICVR